MATYGSTLRRGLPRRPGDDPWPPADVAPAKASGVLAPDVPGHARLPAAAPADDATGVVVVSVTHEPDSLSSGATRAASARSAPPTPVSTPASDGRLLLRRGLPRVPGDDSWPPSGTVSGASAEHQPSGPVAGQASSSIAEPAPETFPAPTTVADAAIGAAGVAVASGPRPPLTAPRTVWPGRAATHRPAPPREPKRLGPFTRGQWLGIVAVGGGGLLFAAAMAVLLVRVLLSMPFGQDFLAAYPGEYHLPERAPVGFPAWLGWQHFFNVFLMVLIIRSGLRVRTEKRPEAYWAPRRDETRKVSLTAWFHQSLDALWLINGAVFIVLLFVTGQWMRVVPTSWEVFPNALSALMQYVSLDWPTENGWVNYNSLQQIAYFTTIFIAAPLAALTGFRLSSLWPRNATRLSTAYRIEWSRALHFPVMLYFVVFIVVHVSLVFATGALRNLNHMYAAQGSVDGAQYAENWTGFWLFAGSIVFIAAAWVAARPLVLAPIARLFGNVSSR